MRTIAPLFLLTLPIFVYAQQPAGRGGAAPQNFQNLKLIDPKTDVLLVMRDFNKALGVQCTYCHVQGAFDSDEKPQKNTARMMITMSREINDKFGDGKLHVRCYTCHRGSAKPLTAPPE